MMFFGDKLVNYSTWPPKCSYMTLDFSIHEKLFCLPFKVHQLYSCFAVTSFWPPSANTCSLVSADDLSANGFLVYYSIAFATE